MSSYVPVELRRLVETRAEGLCEYCLIHSDDSYWGCEIEHIISEKHRGLTIDSNLALACAPCNRAKGSDIASLLPDGKLVRLFNPRTDRWADHFRLDDVVIVGISEVGEVTALLLKLNDVDRLEERALLQSKDRYPSNEAHGRIGA